MTTTQQAFTEEVGAYAEKLLEAGFTIYLPATQRKPEDWFHYSREVDGQTCYGTYHGPTASLEGPGHSMPITPSRLNGSGARVGAKWGDDETLGFDNIPADSVRMAMIVARPTNWCPANAAPTVEAVAAAGRPNGAPKRCYQGATLPNAKPWGIGTTYLPTAL